MSKRMKKCILTCAVTGSIHTPSMSPYLPFRAQDMVEQAVAAAEAGAAILHLHARHPQDGRPSANLSHYQAFLPQIKAQCDAIINITTGGSATMSLEERLAAPKALQPEMCSVNMGSMNFALYPALARQQEWRYDWEYSFLKNSDDLVFKNTPRDIATILTEMGVQRGSGFEFECYDMGHLYMLRHFADQGMVTPPFFIQFVFGVLGGMGADAANLTHMKQLADQLFGDDYQFSVLAAGRHQFPMTSMSAAMGGHVRVGLEDNLYIRKGELATSNAQQVQKIRTIVEQLGAELATPDEVRHSLQLKGAENTRL